MDDRLRRCAVHGPELRAYVEALVEGEKAKLPKYSWAVEGETADADIGEIHDDDDGVCE